MCLVRDRGVPEDCAGTFIMPLMPTGGLMSSELLTEFIGEFNCNIYTHKNNTNMFRYTLRGHCQGQLRSLDFLNESNVEDKCRFYNTQISAGIVYKGFVKSANLLIN